MSLIERIDWAILHRIDRLVAWNRDRGRADQWALALACLDMGLAIIVGNAVLSVAAARGGQFLHILFNGMVAGSFVASRHRQKRQLKASASAADGAMRARYGEAPLRQVSLVVLVMIAAVLLPDMSPRTAMFLIGVCVFDLAFYFKAADPPPPARRTEPRLVTT